MDNVSITFASLVKNNNGFFKSEKQADFLLSQCAEEYCFITGGNIYRNSFTMYYLCDANGIVEVKKYTEKQGLVSVWKRQTEADFKASQEKKAAFAAEQEKLATEAKNAYNSRQCAIDAAVQIAKEYIRKQAIKDGTPEARASRIVDRINTVGDLVHWEKELADCKEFVDIWEKI